jgi:hypothetical protein
MTTNILHLVQILLQQIIRIQIVIFSLVRKNYNDNLQFKRASMKTINLMITKMTSIGVQAKWTIKKI